MDTTAISSSTTSAVPTPTAASRNALGKDEFLKLLTAQLANQDPLQPVDNQAFIAQLAQFSSLEQLQGVSNRLDSLLLATTSSTQLSAASLVGKGVSFRADGLDVVEGQPPASLTASIATRASVVASIQDASGRAVRTLSLGTRDAGTFEVAWDGKDDRGNVVPPGHYAVTFGAKAADGSSATVDARATGRVTGIDFVEGGAQLVVGGAHVKMSDVFGITQS